MEIMNRGIVPTLIQCYKYYEKDIVEELLVLLRKLIRVYTRSRSSVH
jgi:hypothetical protein